MNLELLSPPATPDEPPDALVEPRTLAHRELRRDDYWRRLPAFADVDAATFHHHTFQARHTVTNVRQLQDTLGDLVPESFYADVVAGLKRAPMALRISPHLLALIDWDDPYPDPIRTQFMPVASQQVAEHPELRLDSLHEQKDSPVPGLTHRYPDKALFLPLDSCPVYCRFCTRSYAIGGDTEMVEKLKSPAAANAGRRRSNTSPRGRNSRTLSSAAGIPTTSRPSTFRKSANGCCACRISGAYGMRPRAWPCCRKKS